jgi:drug/metabolite transporter (DMT)-like permease
VTSPTPAIQRLTNLEWLLLLLLSLLWGSSFFFIRLAVSELPPFTMVLTRIALAALTLNLVLLVRGESLPRGREVWSAFFVMGALNNLVPFSLIAWGQTQIASGLAAILNATTPLFTALVAHWFTADERLTPMKGAGLLLGIAGVAVMIGPAALGGLGAHLLAQLAVLGAALSYGFSGVFGRRFRQLGLTPIPTATGQLTATTIMMLPLALIADRPWTLAMPSATATAAIIALAIPCTVLAYILFFRILAGAGATNVSLVTLLIPANAMMLGAFILGERFDLSADLGLALIVGGLVVVDGRLFGLRR